MNQAPLSYSASRWTGHWSLLCTGLALTLLIGCAQKLRMQPSPIVYEQTREQIVTLRVPVTGSSSAGYARTLPGTSRWLKVGSIRQGDVLKPLDMVLTVEAGHVREANIVVRRNTWIGFWMPVEKAFSPLEAEMPINFSTGG